MKILIIEDEILIQQSLKKLLEKKGAKVDVTASGKHAIELIINNNYNRVISDLMLNDITGFDIIEDIRSKYNAKEISQLFILMTAYISDQVISKAETYNCKILNKPFESILEAIDIFLDDPFHSIRTNHE